MKIAHGACSIVGRRSNNEDAFAAEPQLGLYLVADGMGGYEGGEVASRLTVETLSEFYRKQSLDEDSTWPFALDRALSLAENRLVMAVHLTHNAIAARKVGRLERMGSTLAAVVVDGARVILGHLGDSRVYRLRERALEQLTVDHSLYAEMQAAGVPGLLPKERCGFGNVITRALGIEGAPRPELRTHPLAAGDRFLLCTDGLTESLSHEALIAHLARLAPPDEICRALVEAAFAAGSRDNITAIVLCVE